MAYPETIEPDQIERIISHILHGKSNNPVRYQLSGTQGAIVFIPQRWQENEETHVLGVNKPLTGGGYTRSVKNKQEGQLEWDLKRADKGAYEFLRKVLCAVEEGTRKAVGDIVYAHDENPPPLSYYVNYGGYSLSIQIKHPNAISKLVLPNLLDR